jgi:glucose/mannose-6-phosphate isomerase
MNSKDIQAKYDRQGMIMTLDRFPKQCEEALTIGKGFEFPIIEKPEKIIVCGMGGSAMAGELALRFVPIPLFVNRNYSLPEFAGKDDLLVAVSYSGNTEETLSALAQGIERGIPLLCISCGGKMEQIARTYQIPFLKVPSGYQPRAAIGYLAIPLLEVMSKIGVLKKHILWNDVLQELWGVKRQCTFDVPIAENPAKKLAHKLFGRVPLVYGTADNTDLIAQRWKTQINENAKQAAFWNVIPELNHNEILALTEGENSKHFVVFLRNDYDLPRNLDRIRVMKNLFGKKLSLTEVAATGINEAAQVFSQIYLGDYVSFYLALLNGVDPTPVPLIEEFKESMAFLQKGQKATI